MAESSLSGEFLETALLDTLVPLASSSDITEVLASSTQDEAGVDTSLLPSVEQRSLLFFGTYLQEHPLDTLSYLFPDEQMN